SATGLVKTKAEKRLDILHKRALTQGLEILLGAKTDSRGVVVAECGDGLYEAAIVSGKSCLKLIRNTGPNSRYLYFHITESWQETWRPVEIDVEYLDDGGGAFDLEFDAVSGPYKNTGKSVPLGSGKSWKTATFQLPDPAFHGRLNAGADFRLRRGDGGDLWVHRVLVRLVAR
ncbi:MAG TPA: hypothetical protein VKU80_13370, partial [Planctomycetota bacterium]|nr:hypothetical protein [Planctomycetota bacterium]